MRSNKAISDEAIVAMHDAAEKILKHVKAVSLEMFVKDELLQAGVIKWLEIISEAQKRVLPEIKAKHAEIDWRAFI